MTRRGRAFGPILVFLLVAVAVIGGVAWVYRTGGTPADRDAHARGSTKLPTTAPSTAPATRAATQPAPRTYAEVILASHPDLPTTQPLPVPVDLGDAAHFVLSEPLHVCARLDLWITRPDAPPTPDVLKAAVQSSEQAHVTRERIAYVHWGPDPDGTWRPQLVCPVGADGSGATTTTATTAPAAYEIVDITGRRPLPGGRAWRWDRAWSWHDRVIVPTDRGISILTIPAVSAKDLPTGPQPQVTEAYHEFAVDGGDGDSGDGDSGDGDSEPQLVFDSRGLIAWMPWENGKSGSHGAARFVDGQWAPLGPEQGWPEKLLQVVPLLDGSALQLVVGEHGLVEPKIAVLDAPSVNEETVTALVRQLSDLDPDVRHKAFVELSRYGPGLWPVLERLVDSQPVEAQLRIGQLLANKVEPTLGGLILLDGETQTVGRFHDGGMLLYADGGVGVPREGQDPRFIVPAWIAIRPGRPLELLADAMTEDATPDNRKFFALGDEWVAWDPTQGMRRLLGNHLAAITNENERHYAHLVGFDRRGRWFFKTDKDAAETLVIDPTFPDPTPRLPVWLLDIAKGQAGWDKQSDLPAIKRGGGWVLHAESWRPLNEKESELLTDAAPSEVNADVGADADADADVEAGADADADAEADAEAEAAQSTTDAKPPLLTLADGTKYFGGQDELRVVAPDGKETVWPLPDIARGTGRPSLVRTADGRLFLFNEPGRVVRLRPTPGDPEPLTAEAVFTHRIPASEDIRRIWLDPAGRIVIAYDGDKLAICFPEGRIPRPIANLIPAKELRD